MVSQKNTVSIKSTFILKQNEHIWSNFNSKTAKHIYMLYPIEGLFSLYTV